MCNQAERIDGVNRDNGLNGKRVRVYPYQQAENMEQVEANEKIIS